MVATGGTCGNRQRSRTQPRPHSTRSPGGTGKCTARNKPLALMPQAPSYAGFGVRTTGRKCSPAPHRIINGLRGSSIVFDGSPNCRGPYKLRPYGISAEDIAAGGYTNFAEIANGMIRGASATRGSNAGIGLAEHRHHGVLPQAHAVQCLIRAGGVPHSRRLPAARRRPFAPDLACTCRAGLPPQPPACPGQRRPPASKGSRLDGFPRPSVRTR